MISALLIRRRVWGRIRLGQAKPAACQEEEGGLEEKVSEPWRRGLGEMEERRESEGGR